MNGNNLAIAWSLEFHFFVDMCIVMHTNYAGFGESKTWKIFSNILSGDNIV